MKIRLHNPEIAPLWVEEQRPGPLVLGEKGLHGPADSLRPREDYDVLRRAGGPVKGASVLARSQGVCRSMKSLLAEDEGARALLLYPERRDLGIVKPDFPAGPYLNPWTVQRGSMLRYFLRPGDPDCAEGRGIPRLRPALPALPVSESVAADLLGRVEGPAAASCRRPASTAVT